MIQGQDFVQTSEDTHGKMLLDKRTVMRIVDRGVATGRLKHYCIHNPGKAVNMPDSINVILAPEIRLEDNKSLIREVPIIFKNLLAARFGNSEKF